MSAPTRYGAPAIALHWLHAALVLGLLGLGLWMSELPKGELRSWAFGLHKSLGLLALILVAARMAWRAGHPPPALQGVTPLEARLAGPVHGLLYLLLVLVPVGGLLAVQFTPYPLKFFGLPLPKPFAADKAVNAVFSQGHAFLAWTLGLCIALHVAAAIKHAWQRDGVVGRMLPGNPDG